MKKFMNFLVAIIVITAGLTACQQKSSFISEKNTWIENPTCIAPFLYSFKFHCYDFNLGREIVNKSQSNENMTFSLGGCSEVRYGNTVGRNLDWYINKQSAAVINMPREENVQNDMVAKLLNRSIRYGSIGMVGADPRFTYPYNVDSINNDSIYMTLPLSTTDGINENGVYIGVNVAPAGETSADSANWKPDQWGRGAAYTQKEKLGKDSTKNAMCVTYLTRIILDHATSVTDAINIIKALNWYEPNIKEKDGTKKCKAFHWLICDKDSSAVVEFIDNEVQYVSEPNIYKVSLGSAMTNFSNCIFVKADSTRSATMKIEDVIQHGGCGYERYDSIVRYFNNPQSKHDVEEIMEALHYSNFYHKYYTDCKGHYLDFKFPSEHHDVKTCPSEFLYPRIKGKAIELFPDILKHECEGWPDSVKPAELRNDPDKINKFWYTTHTSIYDIANKSFKVLIHEGFDEKGYDRESEKKKYYYHVGFKPFEVTKVKE